MLTSKPMLMLLLPRMLRLMLMLMLQEREEEEGRMSREEAIEVDDRKPQMEVIGIGIVIFTSSYSSPSLSFSSCNRHSHHCYQH